MELYVVVRGPRVRNPRGTPSQCGLGREWQAEDHLAGSPLLWLCIPGDQGPGPTLPSTRQPEM